RPSGWTRTPRWWRRRTSSARRRGRRARRCKRSRTDELARIHPRAHQERRPERRRGSRPSMSGLRAGAARSTPARAHTAGREMTMATAKELRDRATLAAAEAAQAERRAARARLAAVEAQLADLEQALQD